MDTSIVTALGAGSGIDMAALAKNLATAQFEARTQRLTTKSETLDRQISAASDLKSQMLQLASALGERVRAGDLATTPVVANASVASATLASGTRASGSYSLEVLALASSQSIASPAFATAASTVGSGTLTLRFGTVSGGSFVEDAAHAAVPITIPGGATLAQTAAAINAAGAGVSAYVATTVDGAQLVLKGADGAANGFIVEASEIPGDEGLAALAWTPASAASRTLSSAGDARFKFDGLEMTGAANVAQDVIPGLSLTLTGTNIGAPTRVTFNEPTAAITSAMQDLTSALNEIASTLNTAVNPLTGDLARDAGARGLRQQFSALAGKIIMPSVAAGAPRTLADLGLATERDGTFRLDTARLAATLKSDPQGAAAMFTTGLYGVYGAIDSLARTATIAGNPGSLGGSITRYTAQKTQAGKDMAKLAEQQEELRARLATRFAVADTRISASKSTLSFLQNQIAAWNAQDS